MPNLKINATHGTPYIVGFAALLCAGPTITTTSGHTYSGTTATADRLSPDFQELKAAGWLVLAGATGTTAQRPVDLEHGGQLPIGFRYLDTTLATIIVRAAVGWINATTGDSV